MYDEFDVQEKVSVVLEEKSGEGSKLHSEAFEFEKEVRVSEKPDTRDFTAKFTQEELTKTTQRAMDVISRNEDFGSNVRRERMNEIFTEAANRGPAAVRQLTNSINEQLKGTRFKLIGEYNVRSTERDIADHSHSRMIVNPDFRQFNNAGASFSLRNTQTGEVEDRLSVSGRLLSVDKIGDPELRKLNAKGGGGLPSLEFNALPEKKK